MSRWSDLAEWVGPTPNRVIGGMVEYRGLVLHIMEGTYDGSIGWGKNPASQVSFHFANRKDGHLGQLVDTADAAWTQGDGNGHWLSVEHEGFGGEALTPAQLESTAQLYAQGVREYAWPYWLANTPTQYGLGWHGMGGIPWGGHLNCPGAPIVGQREAILARARQINEGGAVPPQQEEDDVKAWLAQDQSGIAVVWTGANDVLWRNIAAVETIAGWNAAGVPGPFAVPSIGALGTQAPAAGPGGGGPGHAELVAAAFEGAQKAEQE